MATSTAVTGAVQRKFGRIAVRRAGNVSDRYNLTDAINSHLPHYGAKVQNSSTVGTTKVNSSSSEFGRNDLDFIMYGVGVTTQIAGISNNSLKGAGSDYARPRFNKTETQKTTFLQAISWTASGIEDLPEYTFTKSDQTQSFGSDHATSRVAGEFGELAYMTGAANPVQTQLS